MTATLRITVIVMCVLLAIYAVRLITSGRLLLRYALLWFAFVVVVLLGSVFPAPLFSLAKALGFQTASNFVLFIGLLFAFMIALSLTVAVSRLSRYVIRLVQENALLKNELEFMKRVDENTSIRDKDC